jgi:outer membrane beta-barrel protein
MLRMWMKAVLVVTAILMSVQAEAQSTSAQPTTAPAPVKDDRGSDKLDLKKLEDKYWSAKDADFSVVQNRTYSKAKKVFFSLSYGPLVNDAYSYGRMTNGALGYYFSERLGIEVAYEVGNLKNNDSTDAFINRNKFAPDYNTFEDYKSLNLIVVPFYAKMSFWDRKIMYFDMQFAFGVGQMHYQIQKAAPFDASTGNATLTPEDNTTMGYNFDVTQQLFFHENFAIRLDIKNKWSTQKKERYYINTGAGQTEADRSLGNINQQDTSILLGLTVFF